MMKTYSSFSHTTGIPLPDVVVWDMDGTILRSKFARFVASEQESNARRILVGMNSAYQFARATKNAVLPNLHIDKESKTKILSLIAKKHEDTDDTLQILEAFSNFGIRQALVSNNSRTAIGDKILDLHNIRSYFSTSMFREDMDGRKKPDPTILQMLGERMDITSDDVIWVVGDSTSDMKFAVESDEALPNTVVAVAMGNESGAARFIKNQQPETHCAIMSDPLDVSIILSMIPDALDDSAEYQTESHVEFEL